jgi:hypothetical protein
MTADETMAQRYALQYTKTNTKNKLEAKKKISVKCPQRRSQLLLAAPSQRRRKNQKDPLSK